MDMLLPSVEFKTISSSSKTIARAGKFITPAGEKTVNTVSAIDTVRINHNWFFAHVSTNETVSERLVGLGFFRRFDYVIFDFVNKRFTCRRKFGKRVFTRFYIFFLTSRSTPGDLPSANLVARKNILRSPRRILHDWW